MVRILVTGGSGFIGVKVLDSLVSLGADVTSISRTSLVKNTNVREVFGDFFNADFRSNALNISKPNIVLHLAWNVEHGKFWNSIENHSWHSHTSEFVKQAIHSGVERFVGIGTCDEYKKNVKVRCNEYDTSIFPNSIYSESKILTNKIIREYYPSSYLWLRLFYIYGEGENKKRLIPYICNSVLSNHPINIACPYDILDLMDVRDVAMAIAQSTISSSIGEVNIGSGEEAMVRNIVSLISGFSSGNFDFDYNKSDIEQIKNSKYIVADVSRLTNEIGFEKRFNINDGLYHAYNWWKKKINNK